MAGSDRLQRYFSERSILPGGKGDYPKSLFKKTDNGHDDRCRYRRRMMCEAYGVDGVLRVVIHSSGPRHALGSCKMRGGGRAVCGQ